ncbi:MAG: hypothetical protein WCD86_28110 [Ktedonobacteraceae bacterium]
MQARDLREVIESYLLDSARHGDFTAQPGSISLLTEYKMARCIISIVSYNNPEQRLYACMIVRQTEVGSWEFSNFMMMGGSLITDLPQKPPPQIAWTRYSDPHGSFVGVAVLPNEVQVTRISLKDSHGFVSTSQPENNAALFVIDQALQKPIYIETLDHKHEVLSRHIISDPVA